jgi:hypothetical protein
MKLMKYPQFDRHFKFRFFDDIWEAYLITEEELTELNDGEKGSALTIDTENCIFIDEDCLTKRYVTHELFHIRVKYFHLHSAEIDCSMFEEICAEWAGHELESFLKKRNQIFNKFKKLEGKK